MIDRGKVLDLIAKGMSQRDVAKKLRVSQQAISKVWRAAHGLKKSKRGGDRRSKRYVARTAKRHAKPF